MEENKVEEVKSVEQQVASVEQVQQEVQPAMVPENNEPLPVAAPMIQKPKKSKKGLIITITILLLLVAGGLTSWLIISNNNDSDEPDTEEKEEKKEETKNTKKIYFYKGVDSVGGSSTYHVKYDYSAPDDKADLLGEYECDSEDCSVNEGSVEYLGTNYDDVVFSGAVIQENDYYNYFDGKNKTKINVTGNAEFFSASGYANSIITYTDDSNTGYAIYSLKANKTISDFKYAKNVGDVLLIGDNAYINAYYDQDTYNCFDISAGSEITDEKEKVLIKYLFELLHMNKYGYPTVAPYHFNVSYIKENGLKPEVYLDSSVVFSSMGGGNQNWISQSKPGADECSLTDSNGKEYKCDELKFYDFDKVDASVYHYFGKHLEKKDGMDSNNNKIYVYVSSINAIGTSGSIIPSSEYDTRSAAISYKISDNKVNVKFAYMNKDDISMNSCISVSGDSRCMKYILDNYDNKKAKSYTVELVWDTDHYYIENVTFEK